MLCCGGFEQIHETVVYETDESSLQFDSFSLSHFFHVLMRTFVFQLLLVFLGFHRFFSVFVHFWLKLIVCACPNFFSLPLAVTIYAAALNAVSFPIISQLFRMFSCVLYPSFSN